jgi:MYXO-CTERM domain-containing protein
VRVNNELKGWKWGYSDAIQSWGENVVSSAVNGGAGSGSLLQFTFSRVNGLYNEAELTGGDSGGGVFIKDGTTWKLAGINKSVESWFSTNGATGSGFNASAFDAGGLYYGGDGHWSLVPNGASDIQSSSYATRISSNMNWIRSVLGSSASTSTLTLSPSSAAFVPEPGALTMLAIAAAGLWRRRRF